jgi:hypothetical protein
MRAAIALSVTFVLGACATPSDRIASALEAYGFPRAQATCVGDQLQKRLSVAQLAELARVARAVRAQNPDPRSLTMDDLLRLSGEVRDPALTIEVVRAGAGCGLVRSPVSGLVNAIYAVR